jgi:hypothetical protein
MDGGRWRLLIYLDDNLKSIPPAVELKKCVPTNATEENLCDGRLLPPYYDACGTTRPEKQEAVNFQVSQGRSLRKRIGRSAEIFVEQ